MELRGTQRASFSSNDDVGFSHCADAREKSGKPLWQNYVFSHCCHNGLPRVQKKRQNTSPFLERSVTVLTARLCFRNRTRGKPLWQHLFTKLNRLSSTCGKSLGQWRQCILTNHMIFHSDRAIVDPNRFMGSVTTQC